MIITILFWLRILHIISVSITNNNNNINYYILLSNNNLFN